MFAEYDMAAASERALQATRLAMPRQHIPKADRSPRTTATERAARTIDTVALQALRTMQSDADGVFQVVHKLDGKREVCNMCMNGYMDCV